MNLITITQDKVMEILKDEELFNRIAEDGIRYSEYYPPSDHTYLGIVKDDLVIGFWWLHIDNGSTINIHCNIIKEHRKHGIEAGWLFLDYVYNEFPEDIQKLNCKIPATYPDVYNFTKKFGFKDEGLDRKSIMKNGALVDRHILGITREELKNGRCK